MSPFSILPCSNARFIWPLLASKEASYCFTGQEASLSSKEHHLISVQDLCGKTVSVWSWCLDTREVWALRIWEKLAKSIWGMDKTSCFQWELREVVQSKAGCVVHLRSEKKRTRQPSSGFHVSCRRTMWWIFLGRALCPYWKHIFIYEKWSNKATFVDNTLKIKREISLLIKRKGCSISFLSSFFTEQWLPRQLDPGDRREMYFVAHRLGGGPKLAINNQAH